MEGSLWYTIDIEHSIILVAGPVGLEVGSALFKHIAGHPPSEGVDKIVTGGGEMTDRRTGEQVGDIFIADPFRLPVGAVCLRIPFRHHLILKMRN